MNVRIPIEDGYFNIKPGIFCELESYLITPEVDAKWNKANLLYRSLITDKNGEVLSSGFPKFFNYGEKPDCYPDPKNYNDWHCEGKIDGSLLIADYVNGYFSMRTRGTFTYTSQKNAKDFEILPTNYPKVIEFLKDNQQFSLLFEIVTPNNVIVVRPTQIDFFLIGAIDKNDLSIVTPATLTKIQQKIGPISVPQVYKSLDTNNLTQLAEAIKHWKGKEGVVVTYNNGQNKLKIKTEWYLFIHRVKSQLCSLNNLIEYYVKCEMPSQDIFYQKIEKDFDYELAQLLNEQIIQICKAGECAKRILNNIIDFVASIRNFENRKQQAKHILDTFSSTKRAPLAFNVLDGKEITHAQKILLIEQNL